jgi:hypothetical protein
VIGWLALAWFGVAQAEDPPAAPMPAPSKAPVVELPSGSIMVGSTDVVSEEITIYGDSFARWDDTRWLVKTEVGLPFTVELGSMSEDQLNVQFRTRLFQVRAVLHCNKAYKLSKVDYEVDCVIEDVAMNAVRYDPSAQEQAIIDRANAEKLAKERRVRTNARRIARGEEPLEEPVVERVEYPEGPPIVMPPLGDRQLLPFEDLSVSAQNRLQIPLKVEIAYSECKAQLDVEADGHVSLAKVQGCPEVLYPEAEKSLLKWKFEPPGKPVRTEMVARFRDQRADLVLASVKTNLMGKRLQLQVGANGKVNNIDLEGMNKRIRKLSQMSETLRQVMSRLIYAYDLKLRPYGDLTEGSWTEYNPYLMTLPTPEGIQSMGSSMLVHQLNKYKGHMVLQTVGRGMLAYGDENPNYFDTKLTGVAIFDPDKGFLLERVWAMVGQPTASSSIAFGTKGKPYWNAGRLMMLGPKQTVDLGYTGELAPPGDTRPGLGPWVPLEPQ